MKWWDWMPWSQFSECWALSQLFHSPFTFIKRLFSSSSFSALSVISSAYLRLLIFLPAILIPACASSSPAFLMMYSADKLNKQGDNIKPWHTSSLIWNQSVVPCPVLTVASWPTYRFLYLSADYKYFSRSVVSCVCVCVCVVLSYSVVSNSLWCYGILRAGVLDGLPCSPPGDLPNPGIKPTCLTSLALAGGFFTTSATQEAHTEILYLLVPYRSKLYFPAVLILIYLFGCARALATTCRIFSCGMQTLSCGIFPVPSALRVWSLSHWTTRRIPSFILFQWPDSMFSDFIKETIISLLN